MAKRGRWGLELGPEAATTKNVTSMLGIDIGVIPGVSGVVVPLFWGPFSLEMLVLYCSTDLPWTGSTRLWAFVAEITGIRETVVNERNGLLEVCELDGESSTYRYMMM